MGHRAGFEPATSRVAGEVTEIFTTDRDGVGGERAMLLPLRRARTELRHFSRRDLNPRPPSWQAGTALYRSNRHLHHRQAGAFASAVDGYVQNSIAALSTRRMLRTLLGSLCHRCPAHRLVPSGRPRALGHAPLQREPRDPGLSFRRLPDCSVGPRGGQQKTLRSGRLGRVREKRTIDLAVRQDRSHEPDMRNRTALGYSACGQFFRSGSASLGSWCLSQTEVLARARDIRPRLADVKRGACENCGAPTTRHGFMTCRTISASMDFVSAGLRPGSTRAAITVSIIHLA